MSWFFEKIKVASEKNGEIVCVREFGKWSAYVNGTGQTTDYTTQMWRKALQKLPEDTVVKKVLILGLGLGNCLSVIRKKFPRCEVTFVEWDPVMVDLAKRVGHLKKNKARVIVGDAREVVSGLQESFDLIFFDIYTGDEVVTSENIFKDLSRVLSPTGLLFFNAFHQLESFSLAEKFFEKELQWRFSFNTLALFHPIGWLSPQPEGYVPFRASSYYVEAESRAYPSKHLIGQAPVLGHRIYLPFKNRDQYIGDREPEIEVDNKRRVVWQRVTRRDVPTGWREVSERISPRMTGYVDLREFDENNLNWQPHARRHLKRWREETSKNWEVVEVTADEFIKAYKKWRWTPLLVDFFINHFKKQRLGHGENVKWFCFKRKDIGHIEAGFVSLDIPELKQSIHLISFVYGSAKKDSVGVGMIYEWFSRARTRGIIFADFDSFWVPGTFASWQGFSQFKSQFGTQYIRYPVLLERHVKKS